MSCPAKLTERLCLCYKVPMACAIDSLLQCYDAKLNTCKRERAETSDANYGILFAPPPKKKLGNVAKGITKNTSKIR